MRADSDQQSYKRQCSETDAQLGAITSTRERYAEVGVLILAMVLHAHREWPAFVIDVLDAAILDYFDFATFHQTIADSVLGTFDRLWFDYDEPSMKRGVRLKFE
jgi:hypothetical protein